MHETPREAGMKNAKTEEDSKKHSCFEIKDASSHLKI